MSTSRLLDTSAGRIFSSRSGSGPPLVLFHGYLVSGHYFRAVRPALEKHFDVIALDLPGHGESDRPAPSAFDYSFPSLARAMGEAMDVLGVPRAHVYGHSTGGGVALAMAAESPARVDRLLLEDATAFRLPMPFLARLALLPVVGEFLFVNFQTRRDLTNHLRGVHLDPKVCTDEDIDFYWERFNRPGGRVAMHAVLKTLAGLGDDNAFAARVQAPTLVVWGDHDKTVPVEWEKKLTPLIAGARSAIIPACGHSPHEERPDELLRTVLPFLLGKGAGDTAAAESRP